jgi:hypothetical protein
MQIAFQQSPLQSVGGARARTTTRDAGRLCSTSGRHTSIERYPIAGILRLAKRKRINNLQLICNSTADLPDGGSEDSLGGGKVDIDLLASQLSQEAERLRRAQRNSGSSIDGDEELLGPLADSLRSTSGDVLKSHDEGDTSRGQGPFGYEVTPNSLAVLAPFSNGLVSNADYQEVIESLG